MKKIYIALLVGSLLLLASCVDNSDDNEASTNTYKEILIEHFGPDYSVGEGGNSDCTSNSRSNTDGGTISWAPSGSGLTTNTSGSGIWYRPGEYHADLFYLQDLGDVALDSVTSVNTSNWPNNTTDTIDSLKVNSVYVSKLSDGYVKFKINTIFTDASTCPMGLVTANFEYSSSTSF